jgi:hypothetical protein
MSHPDIRFIPFAVTEFGVLGSHATVFLLELAMRTRASKGMHVGKVLASWRRKISLAVHVAHADNVLRGMSVAAVDGVHVASSSVGMPCSHAKGYSPSPWATSVVVLPRAAREAPLACRLSPPILNMLHFKRCVRVSFILFAWFVVHNVVLHFALP